MAGPLQALFGGVRQGAKDLYRALHQDVPLWVRAQLKHVPADHAKVQLAVEGLRPPVPLPHAEPDSIVPCLLRLVYARAHQRLPDTTTEPFKRHVQPHQFDGLSAFDALRRLAGMKLGVTRREPADFREQEGGGGIGQLRRLLGDTERSGDVGRHVLRGVISGKRFGEGTGTQFGQQIGVLTVGATDLKIEVLIHTIHADNNEATARWPSAAGGRDFLEVERQETAKSGLS